jgi:hypothetical protein
MTSPSPTVEVPGYKDLEAPVQGFPISEHTKKNARQVFPCELDLDGDGVISIAEAKAATNQISTLRKGFFIVLALLAVQQVMMFGTVYMAAQLASEVHVRNSELRDDSGRPVSTVQRRDRIDGLHYPEEEGRRLSFAPRRLNDTWSNASDNGNAARNDINDTTSNVAANDTLGFFNVNESAPTDSRFHGRLEISQEYFQSTWAGYSAGKSDWVVPFPDGSVRTVFIQGMSGTYAWGICGACPGGNVHWEAKCSSEDASDQCSVEYEEVATSRLRRLAQQEEEGTVSAARSPLLARAGARVQDESGETQGMERSLGGKHCA